MKCVDSGDENDWHRHKIQNAIVYLRMNQQTEILTRTRKKKKRINKIRFGDMQQNKVIIVCLREIFLYWDIEKV